jgi:tetratricopeptide (TPR) repeat protein
VYPTHGTSNDSTLLLREGTGGGSESRSNYPHPTLPLGGGGIGGLTIVVLVTLGVGACQSSRPPTNPGALPVARGDAAPRLNASTYVAHGHLLEQQGEWEQAVTQYRQALQIAPDLLTARVRLGITLNKLGRHAEASTEFRAAIARDGTAAFLHNNLGFSLYLEGKYDEAEQALAHAVELQPSFRRAHMNHGLALARLGRYDEALAAFFLAGTRADGYYNLAVLQTEAGDYAEAAQALQNALGLNPEFDDAREQLRQVARLAAAQETEHAARAVSLIEADAPASELTLASDAEDEDMSDDSAPADDASDDSAPAFEFEAPPNENDWFLMAFPSFRTVTGVVGDLRAALTDRAHWWEDTWQRLQQALDPVGPVY